MDRVERNSLIEDLTANGTISQIDSLIMTQISGVLGDSEELDIDWDDLHTATGATYADIEETLNTMYELDLLEYLDYCDGCYG